MNFKHSTGLKKPGSLIAMENYLEEVAGKSVVAKVMEGRNTQT